MRPRRAHVDQDGVVLGWPPAAGLRSGERRVGKEGRSRWGPGHLKKKKKSLGDPGKLRVVGKYARFPIPPLMWGEVVRPAGGGYGATGALVDGSADNSLASRSGLDRC